MSDLQKRVNHWLEIHYQELAANAVTTLAVPSGVVDMLREDAARTIIEEVADWLDEAGRDARSGQNEHYFSDVAGFLREQAREDQP